MKETGPGNKEKGKITHFSLKDVYFPLILYPSL